MRLEKYDNVEKTMDLRFHLPHGVNGPRILQQLHLMWHSSNPQDVVERWLDVPTATVEIK